MSQENKQLVCRFHDLAWTVGELEAARELLADDLVDHNPLTFPGRPPGADGLLAVVTMIRAAIPDLTRTLDAQVAEDDRVVTRFTDRGTHTGELLGVPASGKQITVQGINIETVHHGRITELWHVEDLLGLMQQLGAVPSPGH